ncbi:kelch-like protein 24 [Mizuhopecten yessoensis]|uniref:Kelch-like protein 24 n=1 Tax=Mizuhopecten yessoensis TaxID=6573 RepID=A0A210R103_MIZYE|nr:kelch-like protein 24 [Mizuhopecten yessoensis]XP_021341133.1 kelch-like protein 24 [Mizuhopecten yessoensis]XP_021341142.1 kelch-like protein 24 [Mizuhopecten yessoensis]OWF54667.1 Kelch-like protein 24 [Mizuhopecten yessoensis]
MPANWKHDLAVFIHESFEGMYKDGRHTDVEIIVGDKTFNCHKTVLAAVSPYFDAMFSSGMRESLDGVVTLHNIDKEIFERILDFVYCGERVVTVENAQELIKAAAIFQVRYLHDKCEQFLLEKICAENCIGAWKLAKSHDCPQLCLKAWSLIMEHFNDICRSEDFTWLDVDDIISIITDYHLMVANEEVVCDAVFRWYNVKPQERKEDTIRLFEHLRLPLLGSEYLLHEIEPMQIVAESPRCREIVKEAISYQMLLARRPEFNSSRIAFRQFSNLEEVLVIIGGYNAVGDKVSDLLAYSFQQERWCTLTQLPIVLGREFATCAYGNDIFVSGGSQRLDILLRYRSENNDWYRCTSLIQGRRRHAMVAVGGSIYVIGGYDDNVKEELHRTLSSVDEYNIQTRSWSSIGSLQVAVRSMTAAVSKDKILVFGGILPDDKETDAVQCFDTRLGVTCFLSGMPSKCKMAKAVVLEKQLYVVCTDGSIVEMSEDGKCRTIETLSAFSRRRFGLVHHNGSILIIGGESSGVVHQDIVAFSPEQKNVQVLSSPKLPSRANFGGLKIVIQKKFLTRDHRRDREPTPRPQAIYN